MLHGCEAFTRFPETGLHLENRCRAGVPMRAARPQSLAVLQLDWGGQRAAILYILIQTARFKDVGPQAWAADGLARIADIPRLGSKGSCREIGCPAHPLSLSDWLRRGPPGWLHITHGDAALGAGKEP